MEFGSWSSYPTIYLSYILHTAVCTIIIICLRRSPPTTTTTTSISARRVTKHASAAKPRAQSRDCFLRGFCVPPMMQSGSKKIIYAYAKLWQSISKNGPAYNISFVAMILLHAFPLHETQHTQLYHLGIHIYIYILLLAWSL